MGKLLPISEVFLHQVYHVLRSSNDILSSNDSFTPDQLNKGSLNTSAIWDNLYIMMEIIRNQDQVFKEVTGVINEMVTSTERKLLDLAVECKGSLNIAVVAAAKVTKIHYGTDLLVQ